MIQHLVSSMLKPVSFFGQNITADELKISRDPLIKPRSISEDQFGLTLCNIGYVDSGVGDIVMFVT